MKGLKGELGFSKTMWNFVQETIPTSSPWHYGDRFFVKPNNLKCEHGKVEYMDFVEINNFMMYLGYKLPVAVLYMRERISLLYGLVRIKNMEDVKKMLDGIGSSKLLEVYSVPPARTFVLSWESPTVK
ncbi:hypothetical protein Adt_27568 [Abeliophyllum distichum]|uniref:Uncharacterized protein n=1 Tax=Abeliophyllum distichum TaxID=126358 RepID=A0ABD1RU33_9LAMI